jgi:soluble lytic murein transglycosylase-like protein
MRRIVAACLMLLPLTACGAEAGRAPSSTTPSTSAESPTAADSVGGATMAPSPPSVATGTTFAPAPDARIPARPVELADDLTLVTREVRSSIDDWVAEGGPSTWPPPRTLVLQTLYQQRIYRLIARDERLAVEVLSRLPASVAWEARANTEATAQIFAHANPVPPSYTMRTRRPEPPDVLRRYLERAEERFGVSWEVLAAVAYTETKFGRVVSSSSAGAQGPMQFLPSTWQAYGLGGDIHDPRDAIMGAANYLRASGAPRDYRQALYRYNPVDEYVRAVTLYARTMMRDPRAYYAYYNWQVFVLTTKGDRRITGPGL